MLTKSDLNLLLCLDIYVSNRFSSALRAAEQRVPRDIINVCFFPLLILFCHWCNAELDYQRHCGKRVHSVHVWNRRGWSKIIFLFEISLTFVGGLSSITVRTHVCDVMIIMNVLKGEFPGFMKIASSLGCIGIASVQIVATLSVLTFSKFFY